MTTDQLARRVQALTAYAVLSTLALGALVLIGARSPRHATFDEIDVERINVRKPDGRLSLVISNEIRMPGVIHGGQEYGEREDTSGLIFYNGDGDETGGLMFGSTRTDSTFRTSGHLAFDGYEQDQNVVLTYVEKWKDGERTTRAGVLRFVDREVTPGGSVARFEAADDLKSEDPETRARGRAWFDEHYQYGDQWSNRTLIGVIDGRAYLGLNDPQAQPRIEATVDSDGVPQIVTKDADGDTVDTFGD